MALTDQAEEISPTLAPLRVLIVGAGALGGYFGARLLNAHRNVTFLVRPATAKRLAADGLRVTSPKGDVDLLGPPVILAESLAASPAHFDLILLSCKAHDLQSAIDSFAPAIGPGAAILPLLNGMAHIAALDQRFGREHVLGGGCIISATRAADGTVHHLNSLDRLFFGDRDHPDSPRMLAITRELSVPGIEVDRRPVILQDMWQKWTFIAASAGITCLMRATIGDIVAAGGVPLALQLFDECIAVATHEGFPPAPAFVDVSRGYLTRAGSAFTASMQRDLESGAPIEAHQIIGDLLDHARRYHLTTPVLEVVNIHLRAYEERRKRESTPPSPQA